MSTQRVPQFTLAHINGEQVSLNDYRDRSIVMLFGGRKTSEQVDHMVEAIRGRYTADALPIVQIATLKGVPRLVHGMAKKDIKGGYEKQAKREASRLQSQGKLVPDDLSKDIVILLDWDGSLVSSLGISDLEKSAVALLVDGQGNVVARGAGDQGADQVLSAMG